MWATSVIHSTAASDSHRAEVPCHMWIGTTRANEQNHEHESGRGAHHFPSLRRGRVPHTPTKRHPRTPPRTARLPPLRHSAQVQHTTSRPAIAIASHSHAPPRHPQIRSPRQPWPGTSSSRAGTANPASASPASGAAPPRRGATSSSSGASPSASSPTASPPTPPATTPPSSPPIPSRTPCVLRLPRSSLPFFLLRRRRSGFSAHDSARLRSARFMSRRRSARKWCPWRNSR